MRSAPGPARSGARDGRRPWLLVIDTATSRVVVAAAHPAGALIAETDWPAGHRHGELLLASIGRLTGEANLRRSRLRGIVVGSGPGAFTGLRVGLATAKTLAHELRLPIAGVGTGTALLAAASLAGAGPEDRLVLLLPAGPSDRVVVRSGTPPELLPGGREPDLGPADRLVAVDLDGRAPAPAVALGELARQGLAAALAALGAVRIAAGTDDDVERLVPEYVTLPRGVAESRGEVAWSRDHR